MHKTEEGVRDVQREMGEEMEEMTRRKGVGEGGREEGVRKGGGEGADA